MIEEEDMIFDVTSGKFIHPIYYDVVTTTTATATATTTNL